MLEFSSEENFRVKLVFTFVAGKLGRPGKIRQVFLALVVGAIPLLLDNWCPLGIVQELCPGRIVLEKTNLSGTFTVF